MKISEVRVQVIDVRLSRPFLMATRAMTRQTELLVRVRTDEGLVGTGVAHGAPLERIAMIITRQLAPRLMGSNPLDVERAWQTMFATTYEPLPRDPQTTGAGLPKGAAQAQTMTAIAGIDIALWDLLGQACGQPLWRLLGGRTDRVPAYATGGYYREDGDDDTLAEEFVGYAAQGFRAVKLKAGGVDPPHDLRRARIVREAIGDDVSLYVDGTRGWSVREAVAVGRELEQLGVTWFEEPVRWYDDVRGLAQVAGQVRIPIVSGESEFTKQGVRDLVLDGGIAIVNFDGTKAGGITEVRKAGVIAEAHEVHLAPHHAPQVHGHVVAGAANGLAVEVHADPERDPLWEHLYAHRPQVRDGFLELEERPGLGIEIDDRWLADVATEVT